MAASVASRNAEYEHILRIILANEYIIKYFAHLKMLPMETCELLDFCQDTEKVNSLGKVKFRNTIFGKDCDYEYEVDEAMHYLRRLPSFLNYRQNIHGRREYHPINVLQLTNDDFEDFMCLIGDDIDYDPLMALHFEAINFPSPSIYERSSSSTNNNNDAKNSNASVSSTEQMSACVSIERFRELIEETELLIAEVSSNELTSTDIPSIEFVIGDVPSTIINTDVNTMTPQEVDLAIKAITSTDDTLQVDSAATNDVTSTVLVASRAHDSIILNHRPEKERGDDSYFFFRREGFGVYVSSFADVLPSSIDYDIFQTSYCPDVSFIIIASLALSNAKLTFGYQSAQFDRGTNYVMREMGGFFVNNFGKDFIGVIFLGYASGELPSRECLCEGVRSVLPVMTDITFAWTNYGAWINVDLSRGVSLFHDINYRGNYVSNSRNDGYDVFALLHQQHCVDLRVTRLATSWGEHSIDAHFAELLNPFGGCLLEDLHRTLLYYHVMTGSAWFNPVRLWGALSTQGSIYHVNFLPTSRDDNDDVFAPLLQQHRICTTRYRAALWRGRLSCMTANRWGESYDDLITRHYACANTSKCCSVENGVCITSWHKTPYGEIDVFSPSAHKLHLLRTWYNCNYDSMSDGNDTTNFTLGTCIHNLTSTEILQCLNYAECANVRNWGGCKNPIATSQIVNLACTCSEFHRDTEEYGSGNVLYNDALTCVETICDGTKYLRASNYNITDMSPDYVLSYYVRLGGLNGEPTCTMNSTYNARLAIVDSTQQHRRTFSRWSIVPGFLLEIGSCRSSLNFNTFGIESMSLFHFARLFHTLITNAFIAVLNYRERIIIAGIYWMQYAMLPLVRFSLQRPFIALTYS